MLNKLKETEIELGQMKLKNAQLRDKNAQLRDENAHLKEEYLPPNEAVTKTDDVRGMEAAHTEKENMLDACFKVIDAQKRRSMKLETSTVENLEKKLDEMQEGYQYQVTYSNE